MRALQICVGFLLLGFIGCVQRYVPLYSPEPIAVPRTASQEDIARGVKTVLTRRGWQIEEESAGSIIAQYSVDGHTARIRVKYDKWDANIQYLSSSNLYYWDENGTETIHARYNIWIRNLERDMQLVFSFL